jgi:4-diphosphocytidyl-2-C-methyl-D-erythritol kinase
MVCFPHSKINLGLRIISKRADGYHDLETCFFPVPFTDILEVIPSGRLAFICSGLTIPGKEEDNLCLKAYDLLKKDFDISPVQIYLHKIIPTGSGLGGGSSDAAFTLKALNELFSLGITTHRLKSYAARLGSDCSFFIEPAPMLATGRGEILNPIPINLPGKFLVLVIPPIHSGTAEAYQGIEPGNPQTRLSDILAKPLTEWRGLLQNDFEPFVFRRHPMIRDIRDKLYSSGAVYAGMSGSGASVFGIFESEIEAEKEFAANDVLIRTFKIT